MSKSTRIIYNGFYDAPLAFVVSHGGRQFLFLREFDEVVDEYPSDYRVFLLPGIPEDQVRKSWRNIETQAVRLLGEVPVKAVEFDRTMRKKIDTNVLERLVDQN